MHSKKIKLKLVKLFLKGNLSVSEIANKEHISRQTLTRWIRAYKMFGETGLENKKPGAKKILLDKETEELVLNMWKKENRSAYKMRKDLKVTGHNVSERQIKKIYKKHRI